MADTSKNEDWSVATTTAAAAAAAETGDPDADDGSSSSPPPMGLATEGFNDVMRKFLEELVGAFPKEDAIKDARTAFSVLAKSRDPKKAALPRTMFMDGVRAHGPYIRNRDVQYMSDHMDEMEFIKSLNLKKYWDSEHMPEATRKSIWDYMTQLLMLGSTIENVDPSMLPMIESFARSAMDSGDFDGLMSGEGGMPDMQGMMKQMLGFAGGMQSRGRGAGPAGPGANRRGRRGQGRAEPPGQPGLRQTRRR